MLLDFKNRYTISKDTYDSRQQSTSLIQARFDKGIVPELDLNQAQIQEAIAASAVPNYERAVAITEHALSILLGRNPGTITVSDNLSKDLLPPDIPAGIPSELLQRRPDILEAEQLAAAQTARIGVAQAMRFPSISLTGMLGIATSALSGMTIANNGVWSASAGLLGPIFEFGKNKRRVEIERKRAEQLVYAYENTVLGAFKEVEDALVEVHTYGTEIDAVLRRMKAANNAMDLSWARYNGGVTSYLEVLYQENEKFNAQLRASEVFKEQLNAYVKLYKALGGGWISEEEKQMAEEAEAEQQNQN
ncbi:MAG: efflux transporter outer membrane subunit, partial [Bacteroidota bacterium]|nr:efflux transporter outer membrane subunit [Bacteroidota bacterium]